MAVAERSEVLTLPTTWLSPENMVLGKRRVPGDHACAERPEQAAKETEVRLVFPGRGEWGWGWRR